MRPEGGQVLEPGKSLNVALLGEKGEGSLGGQLPLLLSRPLSFQGDHRWACMTNKTQLSSIKFNRLTGACGLKNQGRGYLMFLPKSLEGSRLSGKIALILGFISFLFTSFSKICLGGTVSSPSPPPPPVCIYA